MAMGASTDALLMPFQLHTQGEKRRSSNRNAEHTTLTFIVFVPFEQFEYAPKTP
jgi:hypothetical protein